LYITAGAKACCFLFWGKNQKTKKIYKEEYVRKERKQWLK